MTASEILHVVMTVGISQLIIDLLSNQFVFKGENYQRRLEALERARWNLEKAEADAAKNPTKHAKRLQRIKDDFSAACTNVSSKHNIPGFLGSIYFLILLRILGTEHKGQLMAVIPFVPLKFLQKVTARGLDWTNVDTDTAFEGISVNYHQGASFLFVYMLSALSVKFFVHQLVGTQPPPGANRGFMSFLESPQGKQIARSLGVDPDELLKKD
jgi:hypothetical protein